MKYIFYIGSLLFSLSYFTFATSNGAAWIIILATIFFTFGEAFLIPSIDVLIDSLSDSHNKTNYFAIVEFKQLGFFIGPLLAGILIHYFNPTTMYIVFSLLSLLICLIINFVSFKEIKS